MNSAFRRLSTSARLVSKRNAPAPTVYVDTGLVVAAVGRPNVGKSTLFNALASSVRGRGAAGRDNPAPFVFVKSVVDPTPGVTRDPRQSVASVGDLMFTIIDTPGLERPLRHSAIKGNSGLINSYNIPAPAGPLPSLVTSTALCEDAHYRSLYDSMEVATVRAVRDADIAMLVLDASEGVTPLDETIASWLREECGGSEESLKRVMLVANKCDRADAEQGTADAFRLGLGTPIAISGEHKYGFGDLYNYLNSMYTMKKALEYEKSLAAPVFTMSSQFAEQSTEQSAIPEKPSGEVVTSPEETIDSGELDTIDITAQPLAPVEIEEDNPFDDELVVGIPEAKGEEPLTKLIVSIIGRPNVGKSTLLNRLVGEERSLVGPASGVTRDAVMCRWEPKTRSH